ncbi:MAG: response regulator transcription factor [Phaeodactylibacter sp.]|nr:response regulator transcription factor [Phaeodactylibacter sp.]
MTRVSIVEDVPEIREALIEVLQESPDINFLNAYDNGEDAFIGLPLDQPEVVIMDIGLPEQGGIECMLKVKQRYDSARFIMFTVFDDDDNVFEALKAGASGYVLKKDGPDGVLNAIRELTEGEGAPMSRSIARKVIQSFHQINNQRDPDLEKLTNREKEILELLSRGLLYKEIADQVEPNITEGTVKQHIHKIYKKLHVNNRTEAINKFLGRI